MTLPPLHVVLIGPPGAGKSTVGHALSESIAVEVVSTGDVLRREIATGSALGAEIARRIDGGDFVTDEMIRHVLVARCAALPPTHGLVLDGYPRNIPQAEALPEILAGLGRRIDAVVLLDLPDAVVIERLSGRRMCITPTETYPVHLNDPASLAQCKADNGTLQIRPDDAPDIVRHRLEVYHRNTAPLIAYYAERGLLRRVAATGDPHTIAAAIRTALGR